MAKRIISLDFLRGFAIICIVVFHILLMTCELVTQAETDPFSLPPVYLIITVFTVIFAHWRGLFLIISAIVNVYAMNNAIKNGADRRKVWLGQVKFGILLWIFGMFREVFLNEWSIPASLAEGETLAQAFSTYWSWIYLMEALEDIAWSVIITATIFYILTKNNGIEKVNRNAIVFLILAAASIFIAPYTRLAANIVYGQDTVNIQPQNWIFLGWWDYVTRIFTYPWIGYNSPLFPMLGYTFAGAVVGILLTRPKIPKSFVRNMIIVNFGLVVLGVVWLLFIDGIPSNIGDIINFQFHPTWYMFLAIGLQNLFVLIFLRAIEFNPKIKLERALKITKLGRRWGITALTVYSFMALQHLVRAAMNLIFPQHDWISFGKLPFEWSVLLIIVMQIVWNIILIVWEKIKFKYSLEWIFTKIGKRNKPGKTVDNKDLINVEGILHNPEPIMFVKPINEQSIKYHLIGQD